MSIASTGKWQEPDQRGHMDLRTSRQGKVQGQALEGPRGFSMQTPSITD